MKISNGFDARRLRPRSSKSWRLRLGIFFGILLTLAGLFLTLIGALTLAGMAQELGDLAIGRDGSIALLLAGLVLAGCGGFLWRRCSFRLRQPDGLSLAPHLARRRG